MLNLLFPIIFLSLPHMITSNEQQEQDNLILNISELERVCLNSYLFNSASKIEAYKVCKGITKDIDSTTLNNRANQWLQNRSVQAYVNRYKSLVLNIYDTEQNKNEQNENLCLDKQSIITAMTQLTKVTNDPKIKSDLLMKLSSLQGFNKEQPKQESETIRYYLPQRCESCDYKNNFNI